MFGGDTNPMFFGSMDNVRVPYNANAAPSTQFDAFVRSNGGLMNMTGNNNTPSSHLPMKRGSVGLSYSPHTLPVTLNDGIGQDGGGQGRSLWKQLPVSTGLKLSYGEEEHNNSSISSAGESALVNLSSVLSHRNNLQTEIVRQRDELDQYIKIQEENIRKGITELKHRHTISLLNALEKDVDCKIRKKDAEIENLNRKNKELVDKVQQLAVEAQSWHYKATQNESLVNALRTNITQVFRQEATRVKEGCDDNMVDDAVSSCNHVTNVQVPSSVPTRETLKCKGCNDKEVCVLMLPCRHLCVCTDCEGFVEICPVCRVKKAGSLQVYMS
ncbi:hypothetical protein RND81_10G229000 [Saponaria officinalis]|uniref:RING-type domain-containing protein n=1 Tax=Saponaria officinalis TaxID=3572 RepID=A0AAW1I760_SAPOF